MQKAIDANSHQWLKYLLDEIADNKVKEPKQLRCVEL